MPYADPEKRKAYQKLRQWRIANIPELRAKANEYARHHNKCRPDLARNRQLKHMFGITLADFNRMVEEQNNCCAICGEKFTKTPHVDHDHETRRIRRLLCLQCNSGLGQFRDNEELLIKAADYLKVFRKESNGE
jgi:hypothetical protein